MAITSDWHIHTKCSCDSACMEFETLVADAKKYGITDFGVTDHFHTRIQEPDIAASRKEYEKTLENHPELKGHFHFGIEATIVSEWEVDRIARGDYTTPPVYGFRSGGPKNAPIMFDFDDEFIDKYKIDYVVTGMHWPMYCDTDMDSLLKEYHRQYMFAATHPYTDIMAHYMWFDEVLVKRMLNMTEFTYPLADFSDIPSSMKDELIGALKENNVAFELNGWLFTCPLPERFLDGYFSWVSQVQSSGVKIAMGCDTHRPNLCANYTYDDIEAVCKKYGINTSEFFCLKK